MVIKLNRVSVVLSLLIAGTAFSVCAGELLWRNPLQSGQWLFSGTGVGTYSSAISNNPVYNETKADFGFEVKYGLNPNIEFGIALPIHLDNISTDFNEYTKSSGGIGDPRLSIRWTPSTTKRVTPLFGFSGTAPVGSQNSGGAPRYNLLYNGDIPLYTADGGTLSPSAGLYVTLFSLDLSYRLIGSFQLNSYHFSTIENQFLVGHEVSDNVSLQLGFNLLAPIITNNISDEIDDILAVVKPGVEIAFNDQITMQTELVLGLTNPTVRRNNYSYATTPDIGLSITFDIRSKRKDNEQPNDTLEVKTILDSITTVDASMANDSNTSSHTAITNLTIPTFPDSDGDGIDDSKDNCIDEQELFNGIEDEDGCPDFIDSGSPSFTGTNLLSGVVFSSGSTEINRTSELALQPLINSLREKPTQKIELRGFSDHSGGYDINITISQKRANAVRNHLVQSGIESSRVTAVGYGANNPMADNRTAIGRTMNRRIEYIIIN